MTDRDPTSVSARLEGAEKQLSLALEDVDDEQERLEWYLRGALERVELARIRVDGPDALEEGPDP